MTKVGIVPPPNGEADAAAESDRAGAETYRLFFVSAADTFQGVQVCEGSSDTNVLERARSVLAHHPYAVAIEVWRRGVLVGRVDR
jgi:hypothetical protein